MKAKNIPNLLSVIRILLVPVFLLVLFVKNDVALSVIIFLLAGATDMVDGYLARRNNWITNLGKVLDPIADKLMQFTVLISFWIKAILPWWFVLAFFLKDGVTLVMSAIVIKRRSVVVVSKWYGKLAVCLFYAAVVASVMFEGFIDRNPVFEYLIFIPAIACGIAALLGYIKHYSVLKHEEIKKGKILSIRKEDE